MNALRTGSRLHFGLLQPGSPATGERRFGGAGMMIDTPAIRLHTEPAAEWSAVGPLAERALTFAHRIADTLAIDRGVSLAPQRIVIDETPSEHAGLGVGTQLGLAVARLLTADMNLPVTTLAHLSGRGRRSAIGIHGFEQGGFLLDAGQRDPGTIGSLAARIPVPEDWRIVLIAPPGDRDWHGAREQHAFDRLDAMTRTDRLCRLALLGMLPALRDADLDAFGEALHEYNVLAGEPFVAQQGGLYAGPRVAETVRVLRSLGVKGVSQSSWGPTVCAIVSDSDRASFILNETLTKCHLSADLGQITTALNHGAVRL